MEPAGTKAGAGIYLPASSREATMADGNSGGIGVMGVLVGVLIVIVIGGGLLFATGNLGNHSSSVKLEVPKVTTGSK
jgi:hypothetical protein